MAYPSKYSRQYDFQGYQNATPNRPLPGDKVNFDLNAVVTSIDEIVEFLKLHASSSGALKTGVVTVDSLSDEVALALGFAGAIAASGIAFTPTGGIAATNVQAALAELDTDKAAATHTHAASDIASGTMADARIAQSNVTQHAAALIATLDSDDLPNASNVAGATVSDALDALADGLTELGIAGVSSAFGRSGAVVAVAGDYAASLVDNDSGVTGSTVADALDTLDAAIVAAGAVTSVFGRTSAVTAATSDYDAVQVDFTPAGSVAATNVQAAIEEVDSEKLAKAGGTMTGFIVLHANPSSDLHAATKQYVDAVVSGQEAMVFKGVIDCSTNPNYPAADSGDTYRVSVAGKIGGASGTDVEAGDLIIALADGLSSGDQATVGTDWSVAPANVDGAVIGPTSATSGNPTVFDGSTGKLVKQVTFSAFKTSLSLTKTDVGLANVDDTSNATERAATATLTNKTINAASNTVSNLAVSMFAANVADTDGTLAANSDTRLATQKATKTYVDALAAALNSVTTGSTPAISRGLAARNRDVPHIFDWIPSANHAGILAASSTYDAASDINQAITDLASMGAGRLLGAGRVYCGSTILFPTNVAGLSLEGGSGGGDGLSSAPFYLMINHTSGPGVRLRYYGQALRNLAVIATGTRASESYNTARIGVLLEGDDVSDGTVSKCVLAGVTSRGHSGHGIVVAGSAAHVVLDRCATRSNKGHGFAITDGTLTSRVNTDRPGQIRLMSCRSLQDQGHGLVIGESSTYGPYRILVDNFECEGETENAAILKGTVPMWIHGENITVRDSAVDGEVSGTPTNGGISVSGRVIRLINNRYINTVAPVRLVVDPTIGCEDILVDGAYVTSDTTAPFLVTAVGGSGAGATGIRVNALFNQDFTDLLTTGVPNSWQLSDDHLQIPNHKITVGVLNVGTATELTISSGAVTATKSHHIIDTQSDASTDDLDTINGGAEGNVLFISAASSARTVVVKNGTGNIASGSDISLNNSLDQVGLIYRGTQWRVFGFNDNGA